MGGICCTEEEGTSQVVQSISVDSDEKAAVAPGDQLIGHWKNSVGKYSISRDASGKLVFLEDCQPPMVLTGTLQRQDDGWWEAEISDRSQGGAAFGFLRLRCIDKGLVSVFRSTAEETYGEKGLVSTKV
mmetsp:Transcript_16134/g.40528  ORF Transcript_16134/g.40528 Transcript_16134/m.40528 type:complete len:129 (+) Transcript_16134:113-499(+)